MIPHFHFHSPRNVFLLRLYLFIIFLFLSTPPYMNATRVQQIEAKNTMERNPHQKLRRLPHVFSKVLELPFGSDADVEVEEGLDFFRFVAEIEVVPGGVRAHAVEICPGVIKLVVRNDQKPRSGGGGDVELSLDKLELDKWRFRLPEWAQPELATVVVMNGKLVVMVPTVRSRPEFVEGEKVWGGGSRLVLAQWTARF